MILAHGLGGRSDLPVPLWLAVYGGAAALAFSFVALSVFWKTARFTADEEGDEPGQAAPGLVQKVLSLRVLDVAGRLAALLFWALMLWAAWAGTNDTSVNGAPTWFYVWLWVGLVPASLLFGPVLRWLSPLRTLAWVAGGRHDRREIPAVLGAAFTLAGLLAFLWLELVYDLGSEPRTVAYFLTAYAVVHVAAGVWFGPSWFTKAESFEFYSSLVGRLSCLARRSDGTWVVRTPLRGLASLQTGPALVPVVCVLLGSTAFDGLTRTTFWGDLTINKGTRTSYLLIGTAGLLSAIAVVALLYSLAAYLTRPYAPRVGSLAQAFAHTLVPIVCGYTVAHYFSFAVFDGQNGWLLAGDPLGRGWDLFGLADGRINYTVVSVQTIAIVQVSAIVLGHVIGVVAAHDRAVELFPRKAARSGQYPLLAVMVAFTMAGIALVVGS